MQGAGGPGVGQRPVGLASPYCVGTVLSSVLQRRTDTGRKAEAFGRKGWRLNLNLGPLRSQS